MKTLKELKERVEVGTTLRVVDHWLARYLGTTRIVSKVQGNGYFFVQGDAQSPNVTRHWSPWPKARDLTFPTPDSFRVTSDDPDVYWELEFVREIVMPESST